MNDLQQKYLCYYIISLKAIYTIHFLSIWSEPHQIARTDHNCMTIKNRWCCMNHKKLETFILLFCHHYIWNLDDWEGLREWHQFFSPLFVQLFGNLISPHGNSKFFILFWKGRLKPRVWPKMQKPENKAASQPFWFLYRITNFSGCWTQKTTSLAADCSGFVWEFYLGQPQS